MNYDKISDEEIAKVAELNERLFNAENELESAKAKYGKWRHFFAANPSPTLFVNFENATTNLREKECEVANLRNDLERYMLHLRIQMS